MKNILLIVFVVLTGCTSNPAKKDSGSSLDGFISMYERECIDYHNSILDGKVYSTPEKKQELKDTVFANYKTAKDTNNSEEVRAKAINQALVMCNTLKKLGIK